MEHSKTRLISWLVAIAGAITAFWLRDAALNNAATLNSVSYWGTVATLIALLLAVSEIVHSIKTTKTLQQQTADALSELRRIQDASTVSDCIAAIDIITRDVQAERYDAALGAYQHFRKLCVRTLPEFLPSTSSEPSDLTEVGQLELKLMSATRVNASASLNKQQKHDLLRRLLNVKQSVEHRNPANRT